MPRLEKGRRGEGEKGKRRRGEEGSAIAVRFSFSPPLLFTSARD
jgi:hypothetical protein